MQPEDLICFRCGANLPHTQYVDDDIPSPTVSQQYLRPGEGRPICPTCGAVVQDPADVVCAQCNQPLPGARRRISPVVLRISFPTGNVDVPAGTSVILGRDPAQSLVAAAFAQRGYCGVNLADVVEELGFTKGALYFYFPNKESLASEIVQRHFAAWEPLVPAALAETDDYLEALINVTRQVADAFRNDPIARAGTRLSSERNIINADLPEPFVGWINKITDLLRRAQDAGQLKEGVDPKTLARLVVSYFYGAQAVSEQLTSRDDLHKRLDDFWSLVLPQVRAKATSSRSRARARCPGALPSSGSQDVACRCTPLPPEAGPGVLATDGRARAPGLPRLACRRVPPIRYGPVNKGCCTPRGSDQDGMGAVAPAPGMGGHGWRGAGGHDDAGRGGGSAWSPWHRSSRAVPPWRVFPPPLLPARARPATRPSRCRPRRAR